MTDQDPLASRGGHLVVVGEVIAERDRALAEVERLRGRLRELEWTGDPEHGRANCPVCPACTGYRPETDDEPGVGHTDDCWLAAEISTSP